MEEEKKLLQEEPKEAGRGKQSDHPYPQVSSPRGITINILGF